MFRSLSGDRSVRRFLYCDAPKPEWAQELVDRIQSRNVPFDTSDDYYKPPEPRTIPLKKQWSKGSAKKEKEKRYG